ncbi:MAG: hypothetical protein Q8O22_00365 [Candidatus Omnitrophota bacterium]|nr:hypothetical protein [Candidatus Omnitrophota bacterium]
MRKYVFCFLISVFCLLFSVFCPLTHANNIAVSNVTLTGQSPSASTAKAQFDITWNNSWRNNINYDAAWVFVKYSTDGGTTWAHATLKTSGTNPAGFSQGTGSGLDIMVPVDNKGAFLQRSADGSGTVSTTAVQFVWDWGSDKLSSDGVTAIAASTSTRVKVYAVEMVYIPQGAFYAGSGGTGTSEFTKTLINTATATTAPSGSPLAGGYPSGQTAPANASWSNGYPAFYSMKYGISQGEWVDFFNTLTAAQKAIRDITGNVTDDSVAYGGKNSQATVYRNTVSWAGGSDSASAGTNQYVACNYLCWSDIVAFADWAGLRPMTELEYEKACRGTLDPVADEYAWGSTAITAATGITNSGAINETASPTTANCVYNNSGTGGPLRGGFAATSTSSRAQAGASYYGVMELSGNLWNRSVTIGNSTGRAFTGIHGDGVLSATGNANTTNWPGTAATGSGFRGGNWSYASSYGRVSARSSAADTGAGRSNRYGGRCVRTSP